LGSNGDNEILLNKYWYRQRLFDDRLEFRLGKLLNFADLFDRNIYADNYVNSFMNRALVHNMTMPTSLALGAFVKFWPTDWLYMQAAAIDAEPDNDRNRRGTGGWHSAFHDGAHFRGYGEIGFVPHYLFKKALPGKYALGGWYDGAIKPVFRNTFGGLFATRLRNDDAGFYINVEQMLYKEQPDPKDQQGLGIFARYGYAPEEVNRIEHFWSVGAVYEGLFEHRDKDRLGFGVAQSILSDAYEREVDPLADRETVYELYYSIMVTPWLTITPDVQVITNPGGRNDARDALVGGLRIKLVF
jgi:porin